MSALLCILIIVLVIVITLVITQNTVLGALGALEALGASGGYVYPAEPSLLSESEKEFLNDDTKVSKLIKFVQINSTKVLEYILSGEPNVKILPRYFTIEFREPLSLPEHKKSIDETSYLINETQSRIDQGKISKEKGKNMIEELRKISERQIELFNELLNENNARYPDVITKENYKSFPGVIVQAVASKGHQEGLIINYNTKQILYIDSNTQYIPTESYERIEEIMLQIYRINSELLNFQFRTVYELTEQYSCPVFQGSFEEKRGLCTLWSVYLLSLYALNRASDFEKIISVHARNAPWTKRRLQNLGYKIYTNFKEEIDQIQPSGVWSLA